MRSQVNLIRAAADPRSRRSFGEQNSVYASVTKVVTRTDREAHYPASVTFDRLVACALLGHDPHRSLAVAANRLGDTLQNLGDEANAIIQAGKIEHLDERHCGDEQPNRRLNQARPDRQCDPAEEPKRPRPVDLQRTYVADQLRPIRRWPALWRRAPRGLLIRLALHLAYLPSPHLYPHQPEHTLAGQPGRRPDTHRSGCV